MRVRIGVLILAFAFLQSCEEESYIPKPQGFHRLDFSEHSYQKMETDSCPFTFEYGTMAQIVSVEANGGQKCWFNLEYPELKAKVHFSYYQINKTSVDELIADSRKLAMKHLVKADDYEESTIYDTDQKVYGTIYDFQGSTASNYQFYLTDSTNNFIRGALYFRVKPNADSLAPAEKYIEEELFHMVSTFEWK